MSKQNFVRLQNQLVKYWPDQLGKTMIYGSITVEMVSVRRENKFINRIFRITQVMHIIINN